MSPVPGRSLGFALATAVLVAAIMTWSSAVSRALGGAGRLAVGGRPVAEGPAVAAVAGTGREAAAPRPVAGEGGTAAAPPGQPGRDRDGRGPRGVTLVTVPGLDVPLLRALAETDPTWWRLLDDAAVGLMVSNTGGYYGLEAGYLTIGAGARAASGPAAGWVVQSDTAVGELPGAALFRGWTGLAVPPTAPVPSRQPGPADRAGARPVAPVAPAEPVLAEPGSGGPFPAVLHFGWPNLLRVNEELKHPVRPGALGDVLHRAGIRTAALGNADLRAGPWARPLRGAPLITSDSRGHTDYGLIDERTLRADPTFPGGWRTDWTRVLEAWRDLRQRAGLVVIEAGDLGRLQALAEMMDEGRWQGARLEAARALGRALARLVDERRPGERIILLSPAPADAARPRGETLMPIAVWGAGPGLLATPSTRRAGIVTNTDVAPTIAAHLGAEPAPEWTGRPLAVVPAGRDPVEAIDRLNAAFIANYQRRANFIRTYVLAGLVLTGLPLVDLWRRRRRPWQLPLLALAAFPLATLFVPAWPVAWAWGSLLASVALAVALAVACDRLAPSPPAAFAGLGLLTAAATVADALAGSWLAQLTPFAYSPIGGARYYGIGNEYAGVLIGATAVAAAGWSDEAPARRGRRLALPLALAGASLVLAAPTLGSNFGDALAGAIATVGPILRGLAAARRRPALARRAALVAVAAPVSVALLMIGWDRLLGSGSTHVWVSLDQIRAVGPPALVDLVVRKLTMNLKLMRYTNWSYLFVMSVFAFAFLIYRRTAVVRAIEGRYPETVRGLTSIAAGSLAALVLNDSGIVAAATTLVYGVSLLLALATDPPVPSSGGRAAGAASPRMPGPGSGHE